MTPSPPPIQRFETTLVSTADLGQDVREFSFQKPKDFVFHSGQFITILFELDGQKYRRPYSIASSPTELHLRLCVKHIENGPGCIYLWGLKADDRINCIGPLGVFTIEDGETPLVMISTGTGVAPFASTITTLLESGSKRSITLLCGFRHKALYHDLFTALSKSHPHFRYIPLLTQPPVGWIHPIGRVQSKLKSVIAADASYYVCGLYDMIKDVVRTLTENGVQKDRIHFERYD